jgi:hypothetical protein
LLFAALRQLHDQQDLAHSENRRPDTGLLAVLVAVLSLNARQERMSPFPNKSFFLVLSDRHQANAYASVLH